jgi:hypothetical protein
VISVPHCRLTQDTLATGGPRSTRSRHTFHDEANGARHPGPCGHRLVTGRRNGRGTSWRVNSGQRYSQGMSDPKADRYSIEIKNLTTGEVVILTTVDMTDDERTGVVRQLLRLSGAPAALWIEDDEPKKPY